MLSSDIDPSCQEAYFANFGEFPEGDIQKLTRMMFLTMTCFSLVSLPAVQHMWQHEGV